MKVIFPDIFPEQTVVPLDCFAMGTPPGSQLVTERSYEHTATRNSYFGQKLDQPFKQVVTIGVTIVIGK